MSDPTWHGFNAGHNRGGAPVGRRGRNAVQRIHNLAEDAQSTWRIEAAERMEARIRAATIAFKKAQQ
jgi:hypothetical protein